MHPLLLADPWLSPGDGRCPSVVSRVAGAYEWNGGSATGDGGSALLAGFASPAAVVTDSHNNIIFIDEQNGQLRRVDAATGIISTIPVYWSMPPYYQNVTFIHARGSESLCQQVFTLRAAS